jgi:hypothetical protein
MHPRPRAVAGALVLGLATLGAAACAPSSRTPATASGDPAGGAARAAARTPPPRLSSARCPSGAESCRCRGEDEAEEDPPPRAGTKRFEARLSADEGEASLYIPEIGTLAASGARERCFYFDLPAGSMTAATFRSRATSPARGFTPRLRVAEYGPSGPYWYETFFLECSGADGRCDKAGAERWAEGARRVKRGRVDPCGSAVVSKLHWETSGAESRRDGGYFHDLDVRLQLEVKRFATQFAPGSTECVPK